MPVEEPLNLVERPDVYRVAGSTIHVLTLLYLFLRKVVVCRVRDGDVAAGRQRVAQRANRAVGVLVFGHEEQDGHEQHSHRLVEGQHAADVRMLKDRFGLTKVTVNRDGVRVAFEDLFALAHGDGVYVYVNDASCRVNSLSHLVDVAHRRYAGADVEELVYTTIC